MTNENPLQPYLDPESAKAIQEVAKLGTELVHASAGAVAYADRVSADIPANVIGMLGDYLYHVRVRNLDRLQRRTAEILHQRHVEPPLLDAAPAITRPIFDAAADETSDELRELWARLLAAVLDPSKNARVRKRFIEVLKQMDPVDARVFQKFGEHATWTPHAVQGIAGALSISTDEVAVSFENLIRLNCLSIEGASTRQNPLGTSFGNLLLATLRG